MKKKKLGIILAIILAVIAVVVIVISVIAGKNVKAMNRTVDAVLEKVQKEYTVTPIDTGEYEKLSIYGIMNFDVEQYNIAEIGNLSIMRMNMGLMQMATVVITPKDKNLPLLSADYMYILSNRKAYLEFYDVVEEKDDTYQQLLDALAAVQKNYTFLEDIEVSEAWYKPLLTVTSYKGASPKEDSAIEALLTDSLDVYLKHSKELEVLTEAKKETKLAITMEYTDGLIEKGGISTDVFKDALGEEKTKYFFDHIFFGTVSE